MIKEIKGNSSKAKVQLWELWRWLSEDSGCGTNSACIRSWVPIQALLKGLGAAACACESWGGRDRSLELSHQSTQSLRTRVSKRQSQTPPVDWQRAKDTQHWPQLPQAHTQVYIYNTHMHIHTQYTYICIYKICVYIMCIYNLYILYIYANKYKIKRHFGLALALTP